MSIGKSELRSFHVAFTELIRLYQFRDRNDLTCSGLSVSQCHALEILAEAGTLRMGELAARLNLSVSALTRVIDHLVDRKLVSRADDPRDRRAYLISASPAGAALVDGVHDEFYELERAVLAEYSPEIRTAVIDCLKQLSKAIASCRGTGCA